MTAARAAHVGLPAPSAVVLGLLLIMVWFGHALLIGTTVLQLAILWLGCVFVAMTTSPVLPGDEMYPAHRTRLR